MSAAPKGGGIHGTPAEFDERVDRLMREARNAARAIFGATPPPFVIVVANAQHVGPGVDLASRWAGEGPGGALAMLENIARELHEAGAERARLFRDIH